MKLTKMYLYIRGENLEKYLPIKRDKKIVQLAENFLRFNRCGYFLIVLAEKSTKVKFTLEIRDILSIKFNATNHYR